jgi:hypothetical protein
MINDMKSDQRFELVRAVDVAFACMMTMHIAV